MVPVTVAVVAGMAGAMPRTKHDKWVMMEQDKQQLVQSLWEGEVRLPEFTSSRVGVSRKS